MKTFVEIVKECLDKDITLRYEIYKVVVKELPDEDSWKLFHRIKPTIEYLRKKTMNIPKSEFAICGTPQKTEQQEMLIKALKIAKEKTDLKIVKFVWRRGINSYYKHPRTFGNGDYIKMSKNDYRSKDWDLIFGTVLHELVHANGFYKHDKAFYNKLIEVSVKCELNMEKWFSTEYDFGKKYYADWKSKGSFKYWRD